MYDNYLQTQQNVEKELMLTNLAKRGTANVKFQDEEDDSPVIRIILNCYCFLCIINDVKLDVRIASLEVW